VFEVKNANGRRGRVPTLRLLLLDRFDGGGAFRLRPGGALDNFEAHVPLVGFDHLNFGVLWQHRRDNVALPQLLNVDVVGVAHVLQQYVTVLESLGAHLTDEGGFLAAIET